MATKDRPPCPYPGGKQRIADKIVRIMPFHKIYVEPFCGMAAVFFAKPPLPMKEGYHEILNDVDGSIIAFFRVLQDPEKFKAFHHRLKYTLWSREEWRKAFAMEKHIWRNDEVSKSYSDVDKAWAFYVYRRQAFGSGGKGWKIAFQSLPYPELFVRVVNELEGYINRMRKVYIEQSSALSCIKRFDSPYTLFYCDPPYPGTDQSYGEEFDEEDFNELIDTLSTLEGGFILSSYDYPILKEKGWVQQFFSINCALKSRTKIAHYKAEEALRTEVVTYYFPPQMLSGRQQLSFKISINDTA